MLPLIIWVGPFGSNVTSKLPEPPVMVTVTSSSFIQVIAVFWLTRTAVISGRGFMITVSLATQPWHP